MSVYTQIEFDKIEIPADSEFVPDTEWRYEVVPGIGIFVQNVLTYDDAPWLEACDDPESGMKYGVFMDYNKGSKFIGIYLSNLFTGYFRELQGKQKVDFDFDNFFYKRLNAEKTYPEAGFYDDWTKGLIMWTNSRERFKEFSRDISNLFCETLNKIIEIDMPPEMRTKVETDWEHTPLVYVERYNTLNKLQKAKFVNKIKVVDITSGLVAKKKKPMTLEAMSDKYFELAGNTLVPLIRKGLMQALILYREKYNEKTGHIITINMSYSSNTMFFSISSNLEKADDPDNDVFFEFEIGEVLSQCYNLLENMEKKGGGYPYSQALSNWFEDALPTKDTYKDLLVIVRVPDTGGDPIIYNMKNN